ncbi:MAG: hypothetical protein SVS85_04165, partial [Candidatus Nanohaloarchaea archaeon]|nr:hypothetical protein [Candidatus Nanohaloarchaea archaeon]
MTDTWVYQVDSNGTNITFQPNVTLGSLADGQHNVTVWANDSIGNTDSKIRYFTVLASQGRITVNITEPKNNTVLP